MKTKLTLAIALFLCVMLAPALTAEAAPQTMRDGTVFDPVFYAENNPDVVAVFGNTTNALYRHYTRHGRAEGRLPHGGATATAPTATATNTGRMATLAEFDAEFYAANNADVVAVYGRTKARLYKHYQDHGFKEGRLPFAGATVSQTTTVTTNSTLRWVDADGWAHWAHSFMKWRRVSDAEAAELIKNGFFFYAGDIIYEGIDKTSTDPTSRLHKAFCPVAIRKTNFVLDEWAVFKVGESWPQIYTMDAKGQPVMIKFFQSYSMGFDGITTITSAEENRRLSIAAYEAKMALLR